MGLVDSKYLHGSGMVTVLLIMSGKVSSELVKGKLAMQHNFILPIKLHKRQCTTIKLHKRQGDVVCDFVQLRNYSFYKEEHMSMF